MKHAMSPTELKEFLSLDRKDLKVIDVRSPEEFQIQHLGFSENIPEAELEYKAREALKFTDTIVCVCNKGHQRSQGAADKLIEMGFGNVFYLEEGIIGWK